MSAYLTTEISGSTALIRLDFPHLNAVNQALIEKLNSSLCSLEKNPNIKAIVVTGTDKAFSVGLDLKEALKMDFQQAVANDFISKEWGQLSECRVPVIAAVSGYTLGAGLELALMCDIIISSDTTVFGQPEIKFGIIPGLGATQRLTRLIGRQMASVMCMTGEFINSAQALEYGITAKTVPCSKLISSALDMAKKISANPRSALIMAKQAIKAAQETTLTQGMALERQMFYSLLSSPDKNRLIKQFLSKK
ncbi:MAG: enoyl-CoA hydratase/isomerase family protein [Holosporales bacterium]|jgi:enoyl-CoA hydratase/carnithine racemase|nr:enoyl-CoA hydratase/isomerase family protein [Holosporales bacterium]